MIRLGSLLVRLKVLPQEAGADLDQIVESIRSRLGDQMSLRGKVVEPIAFGLSALILDVVAPEVDGAVDSVEKMVSAAPLVGQCDIIGVSRISSKVR